ncbi:MAG: hypothetical protein JWP25_3483 [Bradyrhizobium sp.]|jgi:hypothetical protein|nr:hypothetical protein [Bradyrhizobium sp.]
MTDRDKEYSNNNQPSRHLEESVSSGRITQAEAEVIRLFFATKPPGNWPSSSLQRRMQGSGG